MLKSISQRRFVLVVLRGLFMAVLLAFVSVAEAEDITYNLLD
jgi:hypothetical protein